MNNAKIEAMLTKHGWSKGDGLGRRRDGIAEALKPSLKFDKSGLGLDVGKEFNDHWWDKTFNKAVSRLQVHQHEGHVVVKTNKETKEKKKRSRHEMYKSFVTSKVVNSHSDHNPKESVTSNDDEETEEEATHKSISLMSDEQLFKACGGLTAHKGARHGLKMSGKLARVEAMERRLLEGHKGESNGIEAPKETKKKKRRKKEGDLKKTDKKKRRKVEVNKMEDNSNILNNEVIREITTVTNSEGDSDRKREKKKSKKRSRQ